MLETAPANQTAGRVAVGHPVDVASGAVFTIAEDFSFPGTVPLVWRRRYATDSPTKGWLGVGWAVPYFMTLEWVDNGYRLLDEDGGYLLFPVSGEGDLAVGESVTSFGANMTLTRYADHLTILHWHHGTDDVERFVFEVRSAALMPLAWIENLAGHRIVVKCDARGRPAEVIQELEQRRIQLIYNEQELLTTAQFMASDGQTRLLCRYQYDDRRRLIAAADATTATTIYAYDANDRMTRETNSLGSSFGFRYDKSGRCVHTTGDGGYMERRLRFHAAPKRTSVVNSLGHRTEYHLNAAGQVIQEISSLGCPTTTKYDEHGRIVERTDPLGYSIQSAYDDRGNLSQVTHEDGTVTQLIYDDSHLLVEYTDPFGAKWGYQRDPKGNIVELAEPMSRTTRYERDLRSFVVASTSPGGHQTTRRFDSNLRWAESADSISLISRQEYDAYGNQIAAYDAEGLRERAWFDEMNRPIRIEDKQGRQFRFEWNAIGQLASRTGPDIGWERREYDHFGQLVRHTNPLGEMRIHYDTEGRIATVVNRARERLDRQYDADGRLILEQTFDGRIERCEYNPRGEPSKVIRPDGRQVTFEFDPCGSMLKRKSSDGLLEEFEYDARGAMTMARSAGSVVELKRDALNRVVAEIQNGRTIEYQHDRDGNRCGRRIGAAPGGALAWRNDARGRLISLSDATGPAQQFNWDSLDRLVERRFAGGVETFAYDGAGRLTDQSVTAGQSVPAQRSYRYDDSDSVVERQDWNNGHVEFEYDEIGRLVVASSAKRREFFRYDANGSIVETHRGARTIGAGGRTLFDGERQLDYDANGCAVGIASGPGLTALAYDVDGRITKIEGMDGGVANYFYDALGRRVAKTVRGERTNYLWDGCCPAAEERESEITSQSFFYALEPTALWVGKQCVTPITDTSGAVREVLDDSGRVGWKCVLDTYGAVISEEGNLSFRVPYRFRGQYFDDEAGLSHNFHRTYDPQLGDYLSPDPIGLSGGANSYAYPRNPLQWDDPFGLKCSKGHTAEERMDKHFQGKGYSKISAKGKSTMANGIDAIYYKKGGTPPYIIAESKAGSASLRWSGPVDPITGKKTVQQMSDSWINNPPGSTSTSRLESALPPVIGTNGQPQPNPHLAAIQNASQPGDVGKAVYTPSDGVVNNGSYLGQNSANNSFK